MGSSVRSSCKKTLHVCVGDFFETHRGSKKDFRRVRVRTDPVGVFSSYLGTAEDALCSALQTLSQMCDHISTTYRTELENS